MTSIDLNCDMGESFGAWKMGDDEAIMPLITSANVAAGFHAGDPGTIRATVRLALDHGVAVGAHPSLPDLAGFGRRVMKVTPREVYDLVLYQAGAVAAFANAGGARLHHVKPHGALYNMAAKDPELADSIAAAVKDLGAAVMLYGLAGSAMIEAAARHQVRAVAEVFADRSYQRDGSLTPRDRPGAMITDEHAAVAQVLSMVEKGIVRSMDGTDVPVEAGTLCLHGDQPGAVAFARALRATLDERAIRVAAPG
ncbi:MAG TPA: 5-oxoprolinase subunit PxpA [Burkholderiaceae bacterium]|nr:5-oxoprolinase subunit PxpA [Burkholderiaceae bacterium]HQR70685.1 5-oxoprolinase subunit PxpA [Burkholderiaceae bacterium]